MNRTASTKKESSKRSKQPSTYRRVVTANVDGKSVLRSDEQLQAYEFQSSKTVPQLLVDLLPCSFERRLALQGAVSAPRADEAIRDRWGSFKKLFVAYMRVGLFVPQGDHWIDPHRSPRGDATCYDRYKKQHD
jgi:hypothetical protein